MKNIVLKIGTVVEVRGKKVITKVFNKKNTSHLLYDGEIIKNVSVGSYIKIKNGYTNIIGQIEGEYIKEDLKSNNQYGHKSDKINRYLEISIVGTLSNDNDFNHGISELPIVGNEVFILTRQELNAIFAFSSNNKNALKIGKIIGYGNYEINLDIDRLLASHIGIFGNTGSGKSNTLARIYTNLFEKHNNNESFNKSSEYLIFDFNGEFEESFTDNKKIYNLSTRNNNGDKYPLKKEFILDVEFWSIVTEATTKTQKPFIQRVISNIKRIDQQNRNFSDIFCKKIEDILKRLYESPEKYIQTKGVVFNLIENTFSDIVDKTSIKIRLNSIGYHMNSNKLYLPQRNDYFNNQEEFNQYIKQILDQLITENLNVNWTTDNIDYLDLLNNFLLLQYVDEYSKGYIYEEHIAPLIKRFDNRFKDIKKLFASKNVNDKNIKIISLFNVNIKMRKIIPLLISKQIYQDHKSNYKGDSSLNIIIDEAHNVLSYMSERESNIWKDYRLEVFEEIIKEGRKFGVFLTISSQRPSDISPTLVSQLHNYFIHRLVNNLDIQAIGKTISFLDSASYEMMPILPQGACILTGTAMNFPIVIQVDILDEKLQPKSQTIKLSELWE
jgi:hypothetical protein